MICYSKLGTNSVVSAFPMHTRFLAVRRVCLLLLFPPSLQSRRPSLAAVLRSLSHATRLRRHLPTVRGRRMVRPRSFSFYVFVSLLLPSKLPLPFILCNAKIVSSKDGNHALIIGFVKLERARREMDGVSSSSFPSSARLTLNEIPSTLRFISGRTTRRRRLGVSSPRARLGSP